MVNANTKNKHSEGKTEIMEDFAGYKFKVVLIGDSQVGKTTLTHRLSYNIYKPDAKRTIGVDFVSKNFIVDELPLSLQIWDFSGEARFRNLLPIWLKGARGCIFMYDITNTDSFFHIYEWLKVVFKILGHDIPFAIVGGKVDLEEEREISKEIGESVSKFFKIKTFYECSSVTGENVDPVFKKIAKRIYYQSKAEDYRREQEEKKKKAINNNNENRTENLDNIKHNLKNI